MKVSNAFATAIASGLILSGVSAQLSALPSCALNCAVTSLSSTGCQTTDIACICKATAFIQSLTPCVQQACSPADLQQTITVAEGICASAGVSLSIPAGIGGSSSTASSSGTSSVASASPSTSESSASESASSASSASTAPAPSVLSSATSTTTSITESLTGTTTTIPSASSAAASTTTPPKTTATSTASAAATTTSSSGSKSNGAIAAGVFGGAVAFAIMRAII